MDLPLQVTSFRATGGLENVARFRYDSGPKAELSRQPRSYIVS
jgi:hypothetical protein